MRTFHKGIFWNNFKWLPLLAFALYLGYQFKLFATAAGIMLGFTIAFAGFVVTFIFPLFLKAGKYIPEQMRYIVRPDVEVIVYEIHHTDSGTVVVFVEAHFEQLEDIRKGILPIEQYDLRAHSHYVVGKDYQLHSAITHNYTPH